MAEVENYLYHQQNRLAQKLIDVWNLRPTWIPKLPQIQEQLDKISFI